MDKSVTIFRWLLVLAVFFLGSLFCLQLSINDDVVDLLPGDVVRGEIQQLQSIGLANRVIITLTANEKILQDSDQTLTILKDSTERLGKELEKSNQFSNVLARLPQGYELELFSTLHPSLPRLFNTGDLEAIDALTSPEGIQSGLNKTFAMLNSPAGIALKAQLQQDPLGMVPVVLQKLNRVRSEFSMVIDDGFFMSRDQKSCLVIAESLSSLTDSAEAVKIQSILDNAYKQSLADGIEPRVIGSLPHTLANSTMVQRDLHRLLPAATILLVLLLGFCLRNIRALVVLCVPFLAAPMAIGLTNMIHGKLSRLALGFGIVLLGIAVDFSIHLYLSIVEGEGELRDKLRSVAKPIIFATLTTSAVFFVLLFSEVVSHRQMATLALFGVLQAVVFAWLLIPTIASSRVRLRTYGVGILTSGIFTNIAKRPAIILFVWLIVVTAGLLSWPSLQYNGDLRLLDVPDKQVMEDERHFIAIWGEKGEQAFVIARGSSLGEVLDRNSQLYNFLEANGINKFQSFAPILPGPGVGERNLAVWQTFWQQKRPVFDRQFHETSRLLGFSEKAFEPFFSWLEKEPAKLVPETFLGGSLQPMFSTMLKSPRPEVGEDDYLALTTVGLEESNLDLLLQLEQEIEGVTVLANKKWRTEVERLLRRDIVRLSIAAGCLIVLLVGIQFRRITSTAAVLAPVLSALAAMSLFCYLTDGELNMMHLIMGIMVIGLSVDYGIFIVCAKEKKHHKVSAWAVTVCAASSLIGFGVLAFAGHPALHSLGITVLVGIGVAWPTALFVSPAILTIFRSD